MFYHRFFRESFDEKGVLQGAQLHYPPDYNFAYDVMDVLGEEQPSKLAMLWRSETGQARRLTFGDFRRLSSQAANVLKGLGFSKGDILTVSLRTHYAYWVIALAAHKLGLILSPVYHLLSEEELYDRLVRSGSKGLIVIGEGDTPRRARLAAERAGIDTLYTVGGLAEGFADFEATMATQSDAFPRVDTRADEAMLLYFTSGTTREPKGVLHDHAFTLSALLGARYMQDIGPDSLHFATGNTAWEVVCGTKFYGAWLCEGALFVYDYERFHGDQVLRQLEEAKVTSIMAQPTVYRQMTDAGMDRYDLSSVRSMAVGGEKLTRDLADTVFAQTGHVLYEGYAQSESGLIAAASRNAGRKCGSVGRILPKYRVEIRREDGSFAGPHEHGEIVLVAEDGRRPVGLLMGYFQDAEATENLWDGDIFHTGDLGWRDEEDFLYYLGRSDGLIKTKGYRVSPLEIENALGQHPAVYECLVVGEEDRDLGQRICAYVHLGEGYTPGEELKAEIMAFYNDTCTGFKKIRAMTFVPELRRNANGKLMRNQFSK
ncbi:MAG: acetyl-CoA synthetase [Firmicutes bacterium]|nr:acetyl-CoA synthetase [Bacillota bacterium]